MSIMHQIDPDFRDFFHGDDRSTDWLDHEPTFEWTDDDLEEFQRERAIEENHRLMMAAWWDMEGVRCWTFGPPRNPYR